MTGQGSLANHELGAVSGHLVPRACPKACQAGEPIVKPAGKRAAVIENRSSWVQFARISLSHVKVRK